MTNALLTLVVDNTTSSEDEIVHFYCCNEDVALCGKDISGDRFMDNADNEVCPKCDELDSVYREKCCRDFGLPGQ